jgi:hypothetical protein
LLRGLLGSGLTLRCTGRHRADACTLSECCACGVAGELGR